MTLFAFLPSLGWMEIIVLVVLGVLLFGKRLPDIGRSLGKTLTEFKKGVKGMEDDADAGPAVSRPEPAHKEGIQAPPRVAATAPKFEDSPTAAKS